MNFRTAGAWGAGKGSNLTPAEIDENFSELVQRLGEIENSPPSAVSIASISMVANQITFLMTDGSQQGPFTLPTAIWQDAGEWLPLTFYGAFSVIKNSGSVYLVLRNHTSSPGTFDPNANDGNGHDFYSLILSAAAQPYDVGMFYGFAPPVDGSLILQHVAARPFWMRGDFEGSVAFLRVAASTQTLTFGLYKNSDLIGDVRFEPGVDVQGDGGQLGTFVPLSPSPPIQFYPTNRLNVLAPTLSPMTQDATAFGLSVTITALTGLIS
jgi:hypothetical protein